MNTTMSEGHFSAIFEELTAEDGERHLPFRWQTRLLRRLLDADLPRVVDVPTGLGKTSVMALWLIALAKGASLPRRLVYVVDRRAVVDQATRFARRLRLNMPGEPSASCPSPPPARTGRRHCPAPLAPRLPDDGGLRRMVAALRVPVPPDGQAAGGNGAALNTIIHHGDDHVLIIDLGPAEKVSPRVESLGKRFDAIAREPIIV